MSNVAKLKKQGQEFEAKKQFDKALAIYVKLLQDFDANADELDVAMFNRVGDLQLRQGNVADAVDYYERAVDKYAEGGFFNNAIALCNKILRQSPGRATVYYKLGKISAQKGFKADAKANFLEYAERMQKAGNMDEAFRALKEFADLCPDQDDIRLMLADQLARLGRGEEAVEQLQTLYERYESEGRSAEASAAAQRMRAIDPTAEPRSGGAQQKTTTDDLIFIDLGDPTPPRRQSAAIKARTSTQMRATPDAIERSAEPTVLDIGSASPAAGLEITRVDDAAVAPPTSDTGSLLGLESTSLVPEPEPLSGRLSSPGLELESTSLVPEEPLVGRSEPMAGLPEVELTPRFTPTVDAPPVEEPLVEEPPVEEPPVEEPTASEPSGGDLDLILPEPDIGGPHTSTPASRRTTGRASMPDDTGLIDLDGAELPSSPPTRRPSYATPHTAARAVDGLPMLDLAGAPGTEEDEATPAAADRTSGATSPGEDLDIFSFEDGAASLERSADSGARSSGALDLSMGDEIEVPAAPRSSTLFAAQSVTILSAAVEGEPGDWSLRRELAEAMLEAGNRAGGIAELETALQGAEDANDLALASSLADELARLEPDTVKHQQKRVELAFRRNDRGRLVEAYLAMADVLIRLDQAQKARAVYERVLDLDPAEARARSAIETLPVPAPEPPPEPRASRRSTRTPAPPTPVETKPVQDEGFVNLGDWLREDEEPKDTRMVVDEKEPTGDESADFADMLAKFKEGVAANVDAEDYQSHYDLAIAFKEMGLLDEAISEFQRALAGPSNRLPTYEALGQCFLEKEKPQMATSILRRALAEPGVGDDKLIGVLYLLGQAAESMNKPEEALDYYQRVFVVDIQFKDIADRMATVERAGR